VYGPVRLPTRVLKIVVRKAPSGQGTATFDRFQMRIHKRILDVHVHKTTADAQPPSQVVKKLTSVVIDPSVDVVLTSL
jgi:small subunit ribosomal protein S20e